MVVNELAWAQLRPRSGCAGNAVGVNNLVWLLGSGVDLYAPCCQDSCILNEGSEL